MTCPHILERPPYSQLSQIVEWEIENGQVPYVVEVTLPERAWRELPDAIGTMAGAVRLCHALISEINDSTKIAGGVPQVPGATFDRVIKMLARLVTYEGALVNHFEHVLRSAVSDALPEPNAQVKGECHDFSPAKDHLARCQVQAWPER